MKVKDFFKSKTFKCVLVLLVIALISGGLLSVFSDVLSVSEEERTMRAIKSIYGSEVAYETVFDYETATADFTSTEKGYVEKVYLLADGNYLMKATGKNGYKNGTITVWAIVSAGSDARIASLSIASYDKQTLMSKFDAGTVDKAKDSDVVVSGATYSSKALNNAVSAIKYYVTNVIAA